MRHATPDRRRSPRSAIAACSLALGLFVGFAGPTPAGEPDVLADVTLPTLRLGALRGIASGSVSDVAGFRPTDALVPVRGRRTVNFYDTHLIPRLTGQFQPFRAYENMPGAGRALEEFALRREVTESAERSVLRGVEKAFRDFFIDLTPADRWLSSLPRPSTEVKTSRSSGSSLGFSLGISHAMPELGLRYRLGRTMTRLRFDSFGAVNVEFTHSASTWTHVSLSHDPSNGSYGANCRLIF